jgi:hypothetical protein
MPELEGALRDLGRELVFPATPELALVVGERLRQADAPRTRFARRRTLALVLAVLAVAVAGAMAVPPVRGAILDFFNVGSVEVARVPTLPPAEADRLELGRRIPLDEVEQSVAFPVVRPRGEVEAVYVDRTIPGGRVTFVLPGRKLLMELRGESVSVAQKSVGPGTQIEYLTVNGHPGVWISGSPHTIVFHDAAGVFHDERPRLTGNVLLWDRGAVTLRLEGVRTKSEALELARSLG